MAAWSRSMAQWSVTYVVFMLMDVDDIICSVLEEACESGYGDVRNCMADTRSVCCGFR